MDRTASPIASRMRPARNRNRHAALLAGCALGLVLAAAPQAVLAQTAPNPDKGFQGSHVVDAGGADVFTGGTGSKFTQIDVTSPRTVLTWSTDDPATSGTVDFLPSRYSASFTSSSLGDYTVLNRILPGGTATIGLNGNITSSVSNGEGQSPGGNVWFYTPNGFVVGPSAVIQVGGLVMTTNDITYSVDAMSGNANFYDANGAINFRGPDKSKGSIVNDGSINAGSYVALVSPRVVQNGSVSADRSIAYIAAEQVDLKIDAGNFDFVIGQGTTDANGIVHAGTTTGSASANGSDHKTIQFVAVPKNTALTMLLSGSIGYSPASLYYDDGSAIVLTAGADGSPDGNITIGTADFANRVDGHATGDFTVAPTAPTVFSQGSQTTSFGSYTALSGDKSVHLAAAAGTAISAQFGLSLHSSSAAGGGTIELSALKDEFLPGDPLDAELVGGFIGAGQISVTDGLTVDATHYGSTGGDGATGLDAHGGSIGLFADGGRIAADYISLTAGGYGGYGTETGGNGYGGAIEVAAGFGGSINAGSLSADAEGHGGASYDFTESGSFGGQGGVGRGGAITIADSRGTSADDPSGGLLALGSVDLDTSAIGGNSLDSGSGLGGDAFGGTIGITLDRQDQSVRYLDAYARAVDGDGGARDPLGGTITMKIGGGIVFNLDNLNLDAGIAASINSPAGAFGRGGTIDLTVTEGASVFVDGNADLSARAEVASYYFSAADTSPDLTGGTVSLLADSGNFTANNLDIDVSAYNVGAITRAGFSHGGTANVTASNGGSIQTQARSSDCSECSSGGFFEIDAEGYGTGGGSANLVTGGDITLAAGSGGTLFSASGTIALSASAENGLSESGQPNGVTAQGGTIAIDAIGGGTIASGIQADVSGYGGDAENLGGAGTGGTIDVRVLGGTLTNALNADAGGYGGGTYVEGDGGDGTGGRLTLISDAGATFADFGLTLYADGFGGVAQLGTGGDGHGGSAQIDVMGGTHTWYQAYLSGRGQGAFTFSEGSLAGSGSGSVDGINFHVGGGADLTLSYLALNAEGQAPAVGNGNQALGGSASLLVNQLATLTADSIGLDASGSLICGECSADTFNTTPNAHGGSASVIADAGTITTPLLEVVANGTTGGALTSAGMAIGGRATVGASAGGLIDIIDGGQGEVLAVAAFSGFGGLVIEAKGLGAEGPSAATATGGIATLYTAGGAISSVSDIVVSADGTAGEYAGAFAFSGSPASGFNATGGTASVEMRAGGSGGGAIDAPSLTVNARGLPSGTGFSYPPVAGNGGIGTGGTAVLDVAQGALTTGNILVSADGIGGSSGENAAGGAAFASGNGIGGTATFAISGGSVETTDLSVTAQGIGAAGQGETGGATPSLAATGTGGTARFIASGGTLDDSGSVSIQAIGFGGEGAFNPDGGPGGDGGDAFGGTALFSAPAGGSASLGIAGDIKIDASAFGGGASGSVTEQEGIGGNATGGDATMALADIPFAFGPVAVQAIAAPGAGALTGSATGGMASFSLIDASIAAATSRSIDSLDLNAGSYAGAGAASIGGSTAFTAQVGGPGSALAIINDLSAFAGGDSGPVGYGFTGAISGAPVTVGGSTSIVTPSDAILTISGSGALDSTGDLAVLVGGTFTSTGAISTDGNALVSAPGGIDMTDLAAGGITSLQSLGPVIVSHDLRSAGPVTVFGSSVKLVSLGGLTFADADATAGDLSIETEDDLLLATADATGALTLISNAGSIHNTGAVNGVGITYVAAGNVVSDTMLSSGGALTVDAGGTFSAPGTVSAVGNVSLSADLGMALAGVVSGGTTLLQASNGALSVGSLTSPGLVAALGESVTINSPGALSFTSAQATAGDLGLTAGGNLALAQGGASGTVTLASNGGSVSGAGPIVAGGDMSVSGETGVALGVLTSGGTTLLTSANGPVGVTNLNSAGLVTANGTAITIGSSGALAFDDLDARAGNVAVQTAGTLTVDTVDATGSITLVSSGGALNANGVLTGNGIVLSSLADLQLAHGVSTPGAISLTSTSGAVSAGGPVAAGGSLAVSGNSGISLGDASSAGTISLTAANGRITVGNLISTGPLVAPTTGLITARGRSIDIASSSGLYFADAQATAGDLTLTTAGNLTVTQASATGALSLTSTGGAIGSPGSLISGGNSSIAGRAGIALVDVMSGGTTLLTSSNGSILVDKLASAGSLTAQAGGGSLTIDSVSNLAVAQASATGNLRITTLGGAITGSGLVSAGGTTTIVGTNGVALGALTAGGNVLLTSQDGALSVTNLNTSGAVTLARGRSVSIGSSGALTFGTLDATAGDVAVQTAGNLALGTASATGAIGLTSTGGAVSATGAVAAGGNLAVSGNSGITLATATSGGATSLASANGAIGVANLNSPGAVTATGRSVTIGSTGALAFADLDATAGNIAVQTAGDLAVATVDATGSVNLASTGGALRSSGAINGNGIALSSLTNLQLTGALSTGGALSLASTSGSVAATGPVSAGGSVTASGQTGVSFGTLTSAGTTALTAANGAVTVASLTSAGAVTASGRSIDLRSPGSLTVGSANATAGNLNLLAAQSLAVGNASASGTATMTAGSDLRSDGQVNAAAAQLTGANVTIGGQVRATGDLFVNAGQLFTLNGLAAGRAITVAAGDIAISATGQLGSRGLTRSIALRNLNASGPMNIGGTGQQGQFSLDKTEAARLFADQDISLNARSGEGIKGDVRIGELALSFGDNGNIGSGGLLKVDAGGLVELNGAVTLATVSDADAFSIDPVRIDVIAGSGSIVMRNAAGALQGVLELQADTIAVADRATLDKIGSLTDFAAISSALDTPAPAGPAGGYLQAGTINLIAGDALYIQNGGTTTAYDDRRGFSANELNIETGSSNAQIAINGVIRSGLGDLFGAKTAPAVSINGAFAVTLPSTASVTINGCAAAGCARTPEIFIDAPSSDELELVVTIADDGKSGPAGQLVQVQDNQPLITPPMVDEPITGVGNDDLWQVKCTPEGANSSCPTQGDEE